MATIVPAALNMRWLRRRGNRARKMFDAHYYRRTQATDLDARADAYAHYVHEGWQHGLDPAPWFSTERYLDDHPDVARAGLCPFVHYVNRGRLERRRIQPSGTAAVADGNDTPQIVSATSPVPSEERHRGQPSGRKDPDRLARDLVDEPFYHRKYPDVAEAGVRASDHFMDSGWREGRDPNPWFSCSAYFSANPDVREEHLNPFLHWLSEGRRESMPWGRPVTGPWIQALSRRDLESVTANGFKGGKLAYAYGVDAAVHQLNPKAINDEGTIVISVGNHDYRAHTGGIETCLTYESEKLCADGHNYLYLHPLLRLPTLNHAEDTSLRPILNGQPMLPISTDQLALLVKGLGKLGAGPADRMVVHGLLGHNPAALGAQAQSMGLQIDYWIHDYFAACSSHTLMRNNVSFCAAPPIESRACQLCVHGKLRPRHVRELHNFLALPNVTLLAPSEVAARTWRETSGLSKVVVEILPHGRVRESTSCGAPRPVGDPPTLAFLGFPAFHKGWEVFRQLHPWAISRGNLRLVHLGADDQHLADVEFVQVRGGTNLDMTQAMLATGVDAVLIWPLWPETFSLVTHEALAAGLLVVTNHKSGNVAVAAADANRGIFFDSVRALERSVITGQLTTLIRQRSRSRPEPGGFEWTGLTPARKERATQFAPGRSRPGAP